MCWQTYQGEKKGKGPQVELAPPSVGGQRRNDLEDDLGDKGEAVPEADVVGVEVGLPCPGVRDGGELLDETAVDDDATYDRVAVTNVPERRAHRLAKRKCLRNRVPSKGHIENSGRWRRGGYEQPGRT